MDIISSKFQTPKHIIAMNQALLDLTDRKIEGLLVSMPPRHGKSMLCSQYFPAWYLIHHPDHRLMFMSHNASFSKTWGRKARDAFAQVAPYCDLTLRPDSIAADHWNIENREGGMDTTGVGGSITGRGADCFVADDMIKNHKEALSKTFRQNAWELWISSVETRAEPGCVFLVVGTRWHDDDVLGRLEREIISGERTNWRVMKFTAIAEDNDPLGRQVGEALWPERYDRSRLIAHKRRCDHDESRLGAYWWDALYQQRPTPREGGIMKRSWFHYYSYDDEFLKADDGKVYRKNDCWKIIVADLAVSTKTTADYFCLGLWYITHDMRLFLYDVVHERLEGPDQGPLIERMWREHNPAFIGIESVAYQLALVQDLWRRGVPAKAVNVDKDKIARAQLVATRMAAGMVYFRQGAPWLRDLEDEMVTFPNGRHDDFVDMVSMAAHEVVECTIPSME
jgi:predicted phage terminase large subunit-like protein